MANSSFPFSHPFSPLAESHSVGKGHAGSNFERYPVAGCREAMSSHRPYRPGNVVDKALLEIVQKRDVLYDRNVVDACMTVFTEKGYKFD